MRVVITGDMGFVGTHTKALIKELCPDWEVVGYDRLAGYDINDIDHLRTVIQEGDRILNLAGCPRFQTAEEDPVDAAATNIGGTLNVAKVAIEKNAERVVHASTGSVYMPVFKVPITEDHPTQGNSVYGITKRVAEEVLWYSGVKRIILRYGHIYGEGKEWGAIHAFVDRIKRGATAVLFGGAQSKDFVAVHDIAFANILALQTTHTNQIYNIGSGEEISIESALKTIADVLGMEVEYEKKGARLEDPPRMVFSIDKARKYLSYEPKYNFRQGIEDLKGVWA